MALPGYNRAADANKEIYSRLLGGLYRNIYDRIPDPDYALGKDTDIYEKLKKDLTIFSAMDQACMSVAGSNHHYVPDDEDSDVDNRVAEIFTAMLRHINKFRQSLYELAEARFTGSEYQAIIGRRKRIKLKGTDRILDWWIPERLVDIDRRRFQLHPTWVVDPVTQKKHLVVERQIYSIANDKYETLSEESKRWLIKLIWDDRESGLGYGRGVSATLYPAFYIKGIVWELGLRGFERWAEGILIGKIDDDRAGGVAESNEAARDALKTIMKNHKSDNIIVAAKGETIEAVEANGQGHGMWKDIMGYLDEWMTKVIQGAIRPTGGGVGGAFAQANIEQQTMESKFEFWRSIVDGVIQQTMTSLMWTMNQNNLAEIGLAEAGVPWFTSEGTAIPQELQKQRQQQPSPLPAEEGPL